MFSSPRNGDNELRVIFTIKPPASLEIELDNQSGAALHYPQGINIISTLELVSATVGEFAKISNVFTKFELVCRREDEDVIKVSKNNATIGQVQKDLEYVKKHILSELHIEEVQPLTSVRARKTCCSIV